MLQASWFVVAFMLSTGQPGSSGTGAELAVKGAGGRGVLAFTGEAVEFLASDPQKSRRWTYADLKQIRVESPKKLVLEMFEDRSRWRFGAAKRETFEVTSGEIAGDLVAAILERTARPVTTAVLPAGLGEPVARVPVKHRRFGRGTQGTLAFFGTGVAYSSTSAADSRFWRFADLQSVLRTSPFELLLNGYEGSTLETYAFELKAPLPEDAFEALWQRVNPPVARGAGRR